MSTDRISIQILEDFVKRVRTASKSSQKQITIPISDAENIVYHLNLTTLKLLDKYQEALAKIVGKSRPHITNMLRLLTLPTQVRQWMAEGKLTAGHGRALVPARNPIALAQEIIRKGLNVRQAETLAKRDQENPEIHKKKANAEDSADIIALEKELERVIGLKVKIATKGKAGTLTLHYTDLDQLDEIIKRLRA